MLVYTFSPSALKNNIIDVKMLAAGTEKTKKMAPSAKFPPMFVYTFCPYPLQFPPKNWRFNLKIFRKLPKLFNAFLNVLENDPAGGGKF